MNPYSLLYVPTDLLQQPDAASRHRTAGESRERRWAFVLVALVIVGGVAAALLPA